MAERKLTSNPTLTGVMSVQRSSAVQEHVRGHQHSESTSSMGSNRENRRDTGSSAGGSRSSRVSKYFCEFLLQSAHYESPLCYYLIQQTPAVESAVTRLLVAIKQLLESLTQWSQQTITDEQVSDVYVRLGNDFNAAVAAFESYRIDMRLVDCRWLCEVSILAYEKLMRICTYIHLIWI